MRPEDNIIAGWKPIQAILVSSAVLCADCNYITETVGDVCLACGSHSIVHIEKLLNRQIGEV